MGDFLQKALAQYPTQTNFYKTSQNRELGPDFGERGLGRNNIEAHAPIKIPRKFLKGMGNFFQKVPHKNFPQKISHKNTPSRMRGCWDGQISFLQREHPPERQREPHQQRVRFRASERCILRSSSSDLLQPFHPWSCGRFCSQRFRHPS